MQKIKPKDPQPVDCPSCKAKHGYQFSAKQIMDFHYYHKADGEFESGEYTEGRRLSQSTIPYCTNCLTRLPFRIIKT